MAYVIETDINAFGYLHGDLEWLPALATAEHFWTVPFPTIEVDLAFTWEVGDSGLQPNVFDHNRLHDFVCDTATYDFLRELLRGSLHVVARGHLGDIGLLVLQVTTVFDVVDVDRSIPYKYAAGGVEYPHIPAGNEGIIQGSLFRAPNPGLSLTVLAADDVKEAIEAAGITGWRFEPATVSE